MSNENWTPYDDVKRKALADDELRQEYESLHSEFALAREIMLLRKEKAMTQQDLARLANTSQSAIARLESGRYHTVSLSFLRRIGKVLGVVPEVHFSPLEPTATSQP